MNYGERVPVIFELQHKYNKEKHYGIYVINDDDIPNVEDMLESKFPDFNLLWYKVNPNSNEIPMAKVNYGYAYDGSQIDIYDIKINL